MVSRFVALKCESKVSGKLCMYAFIIRIRERGENFREIRRING